MSFHVFHTPNYVLTGRGCFEELGKVAHTAGSSVLLLAGGKAMKSQGVLDKAILRLESKGITVTTFDGLGMEPTLEMIDQGRTLLKKANADLVISLGGGSVIDAGKAIAGLANEEEPTQHFFDGHAPSGNGVRMIAIPTTAGSGAEVTSNAVLTNIAARTKKSIRHEKMMPDVAIVDPELSLGCPPEVTASAGADGVVQAIESYLSIHANPMSAALSLNALKLYAEFLPVVYKEGKNLEAREKCSYAALQAGMALANAKLGLVHGVAHAIGGKYKVPHGALCGILLPYVLRFNKMECPDKFEDLGKAVGGSVIKYAEKLRAFLKLPSNLSHLKMDEDTMNDIAIQAMLSGSTRANPREVTRDAVKSLLNACSSPE